MTDAVPLAHPRRMKQISTGSYIARYPVPL